MKTQPANKRLKGPSWSEVWILPGLVAAMVVGNQEWMLGTIRPAHLIGTVNLLAGSVIVLTTLRGRIWPVMLVVATFASSALALMFSNPQEGGIFRVFNGFFFAVVGAILASKHPNLVYRQIVGICLINLVFMILQVTGAAEWAQFATTHGDKYTAPTLFVELQDLSFSLVQARPAGLSHSNIVLSLFVLFAIALHFPRTSGRLRWGTPVLCMTIVLSMAKVVLLGFLFVALLLLAGSDRQRRTAVAGLLLVGFFFWMYAILFPGLLAMNLSQEVIFISLFGRITEVVTSLGPENVIRIFFESLVQEIPEATTGESQTTGYSSVVPALPYLVGVLPVIVFLYVRSFRKLRAEHPSLAITIAPSLFVAAVYPLIHPTWNAQVYWFIVGFALLPLFLVFQPRYFRNLKFRKDRQNLTATA